MQHDRSPATLAHRNDSSYSFANQLSFIMCTWRTTCTSSSKIGLFHWFAIYTFWMHWLHLSDLMPSTSGYFHQGGLLEESNGLIFPAQWRKRRHDWASPHPDLCLPQETPTNICEESVMFHSPFACSEPFELLQRLFAKLIWICLKLFEWFLQIAGCFRVVFPGLSVNNLQHVVKCSTKNWPHASLQQIIRIEAATLVFLYEFTHSKNSHGRSELGLDAAVAQVQVFPSKQDVVDWLLALFAHDFALKIF